jgi:DNA-directed RNA polymerase specialized sigma24 family protein
MDTQMTTSYEVQVRRDGKFWFIEIPALDGATQARNLGEVDEMARDYIAAVTDVDPASLAIEQHIELPADAQQHLTKSKELWSVVTDARTQAADESRAAAMALKETGLTMREIGQLLDVSHQRAHQLVNS